jgi:hypothetical protein
MEGRDAGRILQATSLLLLLVPVLTRHLLVQQLAYSHHHLQHCLCKRVLKDDGPVVIWSRQLCLYGSRKVLSLVIMLCTALNTLLCRCAAALGTRSNGTAVPLLLLLLLLLLDASWKHCCANSSAGNAARSSSGVSCAASQPKHSFQRLQSPACAVDVNSTTDRRLLR